jgi:phosphate transport system permease protein
MAIVMEAPSPTPGPLAAPPELQAKHGWRSVKNGLMSVLMGLSLVAVMIPLGFVLWTVLSKGIGIISWEFLTSDIPVSDRAQGGGMGPALLGTILITGFATLLAVPLGILGAVYLNEYGGTSTLARFVRFMSYVMTGVPSIVMGLFIYTVWTLRFGLEGVGGSLALACLMLPVVIRTTETMLKLVPDYLREASFALGCRKGRTVLTVVLPAALPGITSGALLAVARAAGETAPLLFTIGYVTTNNRNLFNGPNTALSTQIFRNATSPFVGAQDRAWGAALTLVALAFLFTVLSRVIAARFATQR